MSLRRTIEPIPFRPEDFSKGGNLVDEIKKTGRTILSALGFGENGVETLVGSTLKNRLKPRLHFHHFDLRSVYKDWRVNKTRRAMIFVCKVCDECHYGI